VRLLRHGVLSAVLLGLSSLAQADITVMDFPLRDADRNRDIPLKAYLPEGEGPFPVIVFSHGAGGSKDGYAYLGTYWAKHGYVCLNPTHLGSDTGKLEPGRPLKNLLAVKTMVEDPAQFEARIQDVRYIINQLPTLAAQLPGMAGKMDTAHIGVAGHSFGASTALALAGARVTQPDGQVRDHSDPRPAAFIALSPQGPNQGLFQDGSWAQINRPVFVITGTLDRGLDGSPWTERRKVYEGLPPGDKVLAVFRGASHLDFADVFEKTALDRRVEQMTLAWWDYTLKGQAQFKATLLQGLPQAYGNAVHVHSK
jgi:predicted dienelactone hydrolase